MHKQKTVFCVFKILMTRVFIKCVHLQTYKTFFFFFVTDKPLSDSVLLQSSQSSSSRTAHERWVDVLRIWLHKWTCVCLGFILCGLCSSGRKSEHEDGGSSSNHTSYTKTSKSSNAWEGNHRVCAVLQAHYVQLFVCMPLDFDKIVWIVLD